MNSKDFTYSKGYLSLLSLLGALLGIVTCSALALPLALRRWKDLSREWKDYIAWKPDWWSHSCNGASIHLRVRRDSNGALKCQRMPDVEVASYQVIKLPILRRVMIFLTGQTKTHPKDDDLHGGLDNAPNKDSIEIQRLKPDQDWNAVSDKFPSEMLPKYERFLRRTYLRDRVSSISVPLPT